MEIKKYNCIDAGTENCPCYLALTGDCLTCSKLQGKDCSSCNWKGVCIYNEFIQGNKQINNARKNFDTEILEVKDYGDELVVFKVKVDRGFSIKCSKPGSFVFMGNNRLSDYYLTPISVMKADTEDGILHLAVKIISAKTKTLLLSEKILLRGPYRNGIQGTLSEEKTLIISKGVGIAPAIHLVNDMKTNYKFDLLIDKEKINEKIVEDYLFADGTPINKINALNYISLADELLNGGLKSRIEKGQYNGVVILASDYFIEEIIALTKNTLSGVKIAVSNNVHICCGEGLCGSCSKVLDDGTVIKLCKCNHDF